MDEHAFTVGPSDAEFYAKFLPASDRASWLLALNEWPTSTEEHVFEVGDRVWTETPDSVSHFNNKLGTVGGFYCGEPTNVMVVLDDPPRMLGEVPENGFVFHISWLRPELDLSKPDQVEAFLNTSMGGSDERQISQ